MGELHSLTTQAWAQAAEQTAMHEISTSSR